EVHPGDGLDRVGVLIHRRLVDVDTGVLAGCPGPCEAADDMVTVVGEPAAPLGPGARPVRGRTVQHRLVRGRAVQHRLVRRRAIGRVLTVGPALTVDRGPAVDQGVLRGGEYVHTGRGVGVDHVDHPLDLGDPQAA